MTTTFAEEFSVVESSFDDTPRYAPGEKMPCPDCGKEYTVTRAGTIRSHKCANDVSVRTPSRTTKRKAPANVYRLAVATGEGFTEYSTSRYLARAIPTDLERAKRAASLSNISGGSDALFGPIVNSLWSELPKGAQKALVAIADHEDLIGCAFAWADYLALIRAFADGERMRSEGGDTNGISGETFEGFERFQPVIVGE